MRDLDVLIQKLPFLDGMESAEFIYNRDIHPSLASAIVNTKLPYLPGVYLVYNYSLNILGDLLYVGKAGADKFGNINTHQVPKRLLAVCYPPDNYLLDERYKNKFSTRKDVCRYDAWPLMMEIDNIKSIKIFCFFSKIVNFQVTNETNPLTLEKMINRLIVSVKPKWAKEK